MLISHKKEESLCTHKERLANYNRFTAFIISINDTQKAVTFVAWPCEDPFKMFDNIGPLCKIFWSAMQRNDRHLHIDGLGRPCKSAELTEHGKIHKMGDGKRALHNSWI